jgi:hypothetical protein
MMRARAVAAALAAASIAAACRTGATAAPTDAGVAADPWPLVQVELAERVALDQELRGTLLRGGEIDLEVAHRLEQVDAENTAWARAIVERHGWPRVSDVGAGGAQDFWLLVQHADRDPAFQERCLALMQAAVAAGEASATDFAYLTDRVRTHQGRAQVYGTQFQRTERGLEPFPIEDPERVDERRASVGLGPLAEYAAQLGALQGG